MNLSNINVFQGSGEFSKLAHLLAQTIPHPKWKTAKYNNSKMQKNSKQCWAME